VSSTLAAGGSVTFRHEALLYGTQQEFLSGIIPFVADGVRRAEPVLVILDGPKLDEVRRGLGEAAHDVEFADMADVGSNPGRIIPMWRDFVDRHAGSGRALRGVGEPIGPARVGEELTECQLHEMLLNVAFDGSQPWRLMCPYDVAGLAADVIAEARRSHPFVAASDGCRRSHDYEGVAAAAETLTRALTPAPSDAMVLPFSVENLPEARRLVAVEATRSGLSASRAADVELAVAEASANSLLHGGGSGVLRLWHEAGALVFEVTDEGRIDQLLAGRVRPPVTQLGGRGLWIVQQLCDLVQVRSSDRGTVVRMRMKTPG
jgi:anti-sigma regulatory factor (Ser/Thr protein kinase)